MSDFDPLIGVTISQYEILEQLGKGGMATVYKARQTTINRIVALKVLPRSFMHDDTFMHRFRREAEVVAKLENFHILPIYDYGEFEGAPYIVMRFLEGGTVQDRIRQGSIPWQDTLKIISQVADALDYAHSHNVVHRDIKPSNIMLDRQGNAYLADFGIAKVGEGTAQLTGSGIVGTPAYMAPEQSSQATPTPSMDVYALGVTLFEMITGQVPYSSDTPIGQILMHLQSPVPSLRDHDLGVPADVDQVVKTAMAKSPVDRFASAGEFAKSLDRAAKGSGGWTWTAGNSVDSSHTMQVGISSSALAPTGVQSPGAAPNRAQASPRSAPTNASWIAFAGVLVVLVGSIIGLVVFLARDSLFGAPVSTLVPDVTVGPTAIASSEPSTELPTPTILLTEEATLPPEMTSTSLPAESTKRGVPVVLVPAGPFIMGSTGGYPNESPAHEVLLTSYYIDKTEVTNRYYLACMTEGPCTPLINTNSRSKPEYFGTEFFFDYPVINVSWDQANAYCEWRGGDLPTEAQWEKAARWDPATGESRTFPWSSLLLNGDYLNYASQIGDTVKVGSYPRGASSLGVLDMAGNVSEWVSDWYLDNYYEQSPHDNPVGPDSGQFKVYRGGSYEDPGSELTTTFRRSVGSKTTLPTLGFRCAFEP